MMSRHNTSRARFGSAWRKRPQHIAKTIAGVFAVIRDGGTILGPGWAVHIATDGAVHTIGHVPGKKSDYVLLA